MYETIKTIYIILVMHTLVIYFTIDNNIMKTVLQYEKVFLNDVHCSWDENFEQELELYRETKDVGEVW